LDWLSCKKQGLVKETKEDKNKIASLIRIAEEKIKASNSLSSLHYYSKISLLYDAIRTYLECISAKEGYKIYNHECYTFFLKEILKKDLIAEEFDKYRKIRNGINYYGKEISKEESEKIIKDMNHFINKIKIGN